MAAGVGSRQYIIRLYDDHAEVLSAAHSKEDTAAFFHTQGIDETDMQYQSGVMRVPITFLDKYCPEQFEILEMRASHGKVPKNIPNESCNLNEHWVYARILIRRRYN